MDATLEKKMSRYSSNLCIALFIMLLFIFVHRHSFFLFPIHDMLMTPSDHEEFVLDNDIGVWFHTGRRSDYLIIYYNGNAGNMSTRTHVIQFLQREFPDYGIAQFDYPGYGLSSHLPLDYRNLLEDSLRVTEKLVERYRPTRIGLWGESMGAMVMMHVYDRTDSRIEWMIQVNGLCSLSRAIENVVIWPLYLIVSPFIPERHTLATLYCKKKGDTKYIIFHARNDTIVRWEEAADLFLNIRDDTRERVWMITLDGRHENAIHVKENQELIHDTIQSYL